jgi:hypothetical protein
MRDAPRVVLLETLARRCGAALHERTPCFTSARIDSVYYADALKREWSCRYQSVGAIHKARFTIASILDSYAMHRRDNDRAARSAARISPCRVRVDDETGATAELASVKESK